eukprot:Skav233485  [mRNA]  locus=scaffold1310:150240:151919:+ [translate_table: standard]
MNDGEASGSAAGEEPLEELTLRTNFVCESDEGVDFEYALGVLNFAAPAKTCSVIAVVEVDGKVLVAVPDNAWHRKKNKRSIPVDALSRAVRVMVQSCAAHHRLTPRGDPDLSVWLALLNPAYEDYGLFDGNEDSAAERYFPMDGAGLQTLPYAPSLVAVAKDHFTFLSGESGVRTRGDSSRDARLSAVEATMQQILGRLDSLAPPAGSPAVEVPPPPRTTRTRAAKTSATKRPGSTAPPGLDAGLLHQAAAAGVSQGALAELSGFVKDQASMGMAEDRLPLEAVAEVSSDEGEVELDGGAQDPMSAAVLQLTKIVKSISKDKGTKKAGGLEDILDRAESGSTKEPGISTRSKAAALRALQQLMVNNPTLIYQSLERRLQQDWDCAQSMPGISASQISARGWVEHRSRIQNYATSVHYSWILAGIWDALRLGRIPEARARAALGVAVVDQVNIDRGSFLLARELMLEEAPPAHAFNAHHLPDQWEAAHTRLVDSRWLELIMAKLTDVAQFQEKKVKLAPTKKADDSKPAPKTEAKPKAKKKGGGKGDDKAPPPAAESTTS